MADAADALLLDLLEWIAREPRRYSETMEAWRTSCPRLTIWEDAVDRGFVRRDFTEGRGAVVVVTAVGLKFLRDHRR